MLDLEKVRRRLPDGWRLEWHEQVTSTNDLAIAAARSGQSEGLVIGAETQTRGRGRQGRRWLDVPGQSLLFSVLLRPPGRCPRQLIGLTAAVAVADAAKKHGAGLLLRWPNDLLWRERKVCGILTETAAGAVIVGIGINVSGAQALPAELRAAAVCEAAGRAIDRERLLADVLGALAARYNQLCSGRADEVVAAARQLDMLAGREVAVQSGNGEVVGRCLGIDNAGRLLVETSAGRVAVHAGEVVGVH